MLSEVGIAHPCRALSRFNQSIESCSNSAVGDKVEAADRRGDRFEKRRRLMADWAA